MKLLITGTAYPCKGRPSFKDPVRFTLPGDKPSIDALGDTLTLTDDNGFVFRALAVSEYTRWYISGDELIGTNAPEPEPVTPEPVVPQSTIADLEAAMCEMGAANDERMSAIEDALCDLDSTNGGAV